MKVELGNTVSTLLESTDDERSWLRDYLSFEDEGRAFRKNRKTGRVERVKPPMIRLFDVLGDTFPTGLIPLVRKRVLDSGGTFELRDARTPPAAVDANADLDWLRDYQLEALRAAVGRERGILHLPTGSGKTEVAVALTRVLPIRWLLIVHRAGLMHQAAERWEQRELESMGLDPEVEDAARRLGAGRPGRFGDGAVELGERLTVATFQTVRAKADTVPGRELIRRTEGLIVDEAHTLPAGTFYAVAMAFRGARYRIGLSGTPLDRDDKRSLMAVGALGPIIYRLRTDTLVDAGVLAVPRVRMIPVVQYVSRPTYQGVYGEAVVRSSKRNATIAKVVAHVASKPAVVFVKEIAHGRNLRKALEREGLAVELVWGNTPQTARAAAMKGLARGDLDAVVASVVWQEGIDVPELRSVVVATAGKSVIAALQRAGRGMRKAEGKDSFELYDVADEGNHILERHAKARRKAYEREGFEVVEAELDQLPLAALEAAR